MFMICFTPPGVVSHTFPAESASRGAVRSLLHQLTEGGLILTSLETRGVL